ncbi:MAG: RNA-binding protein [Verrucomicrobia bacterium]|nr:RNA-binding protein [Verrucomicrobiota bacterium]
MNIFVGNLSFSTEEEALRQLFEPHGEVTSVSVIKDRDTGRSRGFAFVEMPNSEEGRSAISAVNGVDLDGRSLKADEARDRGDRGGGGRPSRDRW